MTIYMPLFSCKKKLERLQHKINKMKMIQGTFEGYGMEPNNIATLCHGGEGWNLFINERANEYMVICALYYITKNKRAFLFDMKTTEDYKIELCIEKKKQEN